MLPWVDDIEGYAIFLDLDGTIVEIVEHPDAARVAPETLRLLEALREKSQNAVAVISGRELVVIDRLLHPLKLPAAGVHGLERRDATGMMHLSAPLDLQPITFVLEKNIGDESGVVVEKKSGAVAVHYRLRPDLERRCCKVVEELVGQRADLRILHGKMVIEIIQNGLNKGDVINAFLSERPFRGRIPVFAGDDVTDEAGFAVVNSRGGISIKVGAQKTEAQYRAEDVRDLERWLWNLVVEHCEDRAR